MFYAKFGFTISNNENSENCKVVTIHKYVS